jgi:electron transport complex protein RnfA
VGELFLIVVSTGLVSNLVLDHMLGTDPLTAVSHKTETAGRLCLFMLLVMPPVALLSSLLNFRLLVPMELVYLQLLSLVLLATATVLIIATLLFRFKPVVYKKIELFIPLMLVNCTVLGVALLNTRYDYGAVAALFSGLGYAAGYSLALLAIAAIHERVTVADVPAPFKGTPILLITLGLLSMAFMGFNGISTLP